MSQSKGMLTDGALQAGQAHTPSMGQGKPAPRDARDMMMRDEEAAGSAGGMFSRLNFNAEIERESRVKSLFPSNATMGKLVQTLGMRKKEDDAASKSAGVSYVPPEMSDLTSDYVRMGGQGSKGDEAGSVPTSTGVVNAEQKTAPSGGHANSSSASSSQLRCYNCSVVMSYPPGVQQVRCPECSSINATSSTTAAGQSSKTANVSVSCCGCQKPTVCSSSATRMTCPHCSIQNLIVTCQNPACAAVVSCSSGAAVMGCPACKTVNNIAGAQAAKQEIHVTCVGCMCRLMMPASAPAVRCPKCSTITQRTDPRAKVTPATRPAAPAASSAQQAAAAAISEEEAVQEAIRRSLGQPARPMSSRGGTRSHSAPDGAGAVDDAMMARALKTFTDITGCEPDVATDFLKSNGWRMENAINHYLEHVQSRNVTASSSSPIQSNKTVQWKPLIQQTQSYIPQEPPSAHHPPLSDAASVQAPAASAERLAPSSQPPPAAATAKEQEIVEWRGVGDWLQSLGLEKYESVLRAQELTDPEALRDVTDEDLKEMNISTIGARRKMLASIRHLNESKIVRVEVQNDPKPGGGDVAGLSGGNGLLDEIHLDLPQPGPSLGDIRVASAEVPEIRSGMDLAAEAEFVKPIVAENSISVDDAEVPAITSQSIRAPEDVLQ